jgi:outer membrane immunogenic protein
MKIKSANLFLSTFLLSVPAIANSTNAKVDNNDWTGSYVGVNVGGKATDVSWQTTDIKPAGFASVTPDSSSSRTFDTASARVGGYAGYNLQISKFVIGADINFAWANNINTTSGVPGCTVACFGGLPGPANDLSSVRMKWDGSIASRLGYLLNKDTLMYGIGGIAFQGIKTSATCQRSDPDPLCLSAPGNPYLTESHSSIMVGYTVGGGLEEKFGNWVMRAEYRYSGFGDLNTTSTFSDSTIISYTVPVNTHIAFMGLAYKF